MAIVDVGWTHDLLCSGACALQFQSCRKQASPGATHQTSRTSVDNAVSTKRAKLRASSRIHQPPPKIHHNPHKVPVPASPPPCHPRASAHILATCSPPIHSKYAGHLHGKEGLPGPFRRIDGGGSVPLRPVRAPRRVISSAPSTPEPAPAPAAAHPPGIRPRHRQARLPVGQAADAAHLQDRADRAGLRHHRCVLVFVLLCCCRWHGCDGKLNYARHNNMHSEWDVSTAPGIWHAIACLVNVYPPSPFNACCVMG